MSDELFKEVNRIVKKVAKSFNIKAEDKEAFLSDTATPAVILETLGEYKDQLPNFNKAKDRQGYIDAVMDEIDSL